MHPLAPAARLHDEAIAKLIVAGRALSAGDVDGYHATVRDVLSLLASADWAASAPQLGPHFLEQHGIDLRSREADTQPLRVRIGKPSEGA
jgi:hypothetical protein